MIYVVDVKNNTTGEVRTGEMELRFKPVCDCTLAGVFGDTDIMCGYRRYTLLKAEAKA